MKASNIKPGDILAVEYDPQPYLVAYDGDGTLCLFDMGRRGYGQGDSIVDWSTLADEMPDRVGSHEDVLWVRAHSEVEPDGYHREGNVRVQGVDGYPLTAAETKAVLGPWKERGALLEKRRARKAAGKQAAETRKQNQQDEKARRFDEATAQRRAERAAVLDAIGVRGEVRAMGNAFFHRTGVRVHVSASGDAIDSVSVYDHTDTLDGDSTIDMAAVIRAVHAELIRQGLVEAATGTQ